jgi:hypothetical protein
LELNTAVEETCKVAGARADEKRRRKLKLGHGWMAGEVTVTA